MAGFQLMDTTNGLLNEKYWDNRWQSSQTGWDLNGVSPPLQAYIDTVTNKDVSILIPGCGNAYEAQYLVLKGFQNITLIDISETLVDKLRKKPELEKVAVLHSDFFAHHLHYDLILEQTFFCALHPSQRRNYVKHMHSLLNKNGKLTGLLFDKIFEADGPPFGGTKQEYQDLFEPYFDILRFEPCTNSIEPRLGSELFIEFRKK